MGTGLQGYNAQTNSYTTGAITDSSSGARYMPSAAKQTSSGPDPVQQYIAQQNAHALAVQQATKEFGLQNRDQVPQGAVTPAGAVGGGMGGGASASAGAMGGLAEALGVEDPMSAMSLPVGLREGLGRRAYPTLVNALAGLRY